MLRNIFSSLVIFSTLFFLSCSKDKNDSGNTLSDTPLAKAAYNNSNYGIYKGIFVGSSGIVIVNINNDNTISATVRIDGNTYNFTTTQTVQQGQGTELQFTSGGNSFAFFVNGNGENPTVSGLVFNGHPDAAILVVKETSTTLVKCYEGTYSGNDQGIFNAVIYGSQIKGIIRSSVFNGTEIATGTVSNNQINAAGTVTSGAIFSGDVSGNNISGNWSNSLSSQTGTWSGSRTY